jgi:hypothetical protein
MSTPTEGDYEFATATFGLVDTGADSWMIEAKDGSGEAIVVPEMELWRLAQQMIAAYVAGSRKRGERKRVIAKRG